MLKTKNPNAVFNELMSVNPQFSKFVNDNRGKSAEQIAKEHGINMDDIKKLIK